MELNQIKHISSNIKDNETNRFILIYHISVVLAESALEIIPPEIRNTELIINYSKKVGQEISELFLDKSYHYSAMKEKNIDYIWKRGRPDLVHICLLSILSTPLFLKNLVDVYIHTIDNKVIFIGQQVRIPKSYRRFEGLMIKLYKEKEIISNEKDYNKYLLKIEKNITFDNLVDKVIKPDKIIGFSSTGILKDLKNIVNENIETNNKKISFVIGGFQGGHFSQSTRERFHMTYSIANEHLEAHVVISRLVYECENRLSFLNGQS
ncbi:MAG: ribosome biogenesis protein [Nitrososphaeraceae archaeon]